MKSMESRGAWAGRLKAAEVLVPATSPMQLVLQLGSGAFWADDSEMESELTSLCMASL